MTSERRRRLRILLVEDEALIAFLLEDMLLDLDCRVVAQACRLSEGLEAAERGDFDVALLDVNLGPSDRSFPIARRLEERGVPFAFVTAYGVGAAREAFPDAPVVPKPFMMHDLRQALERATA